MRLAQLPLRIDSAIAAVQRGKSSGSAPARARAKNDTAKKRSRKPASFVPQSIAGTADLPIVAVFPLHLRSVSNVSGGWRKRDHTAATTNLLIIRSLAKSFGWPARAIQHFPKTLLLFVASTAPRHGIVPPIDVTITRLAPRTVDRSNRDNAAKHVIDAVSRWLGVDDSREDLVSYEVQQITSATYGCRVEIRRRFS